MEASAINHAFSLGVSENVPDTDNDGVCDAQDPCPTTAPGAGDVFTDAIDLTLSGGAIGNVDCHNNTYTDSSTPGDASASSLSDVFYSFTTGACASDLDVQLCGPQVLHLLDASGAHIALGDDSSLPPACGVSFTTGARITASVLPNTLYYLVVEGAQGQPDFVLNIEEGEDDSDNDGLCDAQDPCPTTAPGAGDVFTDAIDLTLSGGAIGNVDCHNNTYTDSSTPGDASASSLSDVFYSFTTGACASDLDVQLCGPQVLHLLDASGAHIALGDDSSLPPACGVSFTTGARITASVLPNTLYYLVVEGAQGQPDFVLNIEEGEDDSDNDGLCDAQDDCPGTLIGEGVNTAGCSCSQVIVSDGDGCTEDLCTNGSVTHPAVNADDGDACTLDACAGGVVTHTPIICSDSDLCTQDLCIAGVCSHPPLVAINDGDPCTTDGCIGGVISHTPIVCNDSNPCTTDACVGGICQFTNVADGTSCGVGFQCLGGVCTPIGGCANNNISLELQTDANGAQTNWDIVLISTNTVQCSGGISPTYPNNTLITANCCLPDGCYELRVKDTFGDGMTTGGYRLKDQFGNRIIDNWGDGVFGSLSQIALNTGFCLDLSTDAMEPTSCDQMNLSTSSILVANERTAVTAQFGITNSTSGYQFLIFNPDGGYVRYVFQNMTTGAGVGSQKSRSLLISSLVTNPVPSFQLLNIRVRSRVAGVYAAFGRACRMKINPAGACPTTQLDNIPANIGTTYSCGATGKVVGAMSYTGKIYSIPVAGATNYRFRLASGAYTRIISVTTSYLTLGAWSTQPLLCGTHTYNVDIAISKNSGASYCPYGSTCTVGITNPGGATPCTAPFSGGSTHAMDMTEESGVLTMWPNPILRQAQDGDQIHLQMTGISADVNEVSVDVHDLFGKRVINEVVFTGGGDLNHVMQLGGQLSSGLYTVTVTAGRNRAVERLVVE